MENWGGKAALYCAWCGLGLEAGTFSASCVSALPCTRQELHRGTVLPTVGTHVMAVCLNVKQPQEVHVVAQKEEMQVRWLGKEKGFVIHPLEGRGVVLASFQNHQRSDGIRVKEFAAIQAVEKLLL